jgi:hypothetical protein
MIKYANMVDIPVILPKTHNSTDRKYMTMTVDIDPIKYALDTFSEYLVEIKAACTSANKLYTEYDKILKLQQKSLETAKKQKDTDEQEEVSILKINFPNEFQINTAAYCSAKHLLASNYRESYPVENIPDSGMSDDIKLLLMAGVGILSDGVTCDIYKSQVMSQMASGQLAYVITDHTGCYGVNMLVNKVVITPAFAAVASTATIEQAGGRLCRVGLTYSGTLVLPENIIRRLYSNMTQLSVEAQNMEQVFNELKLKEV